MIARTPMVGPRAMLLSCLCSPTLVACTPAPEVLPGQETGPCVEGDCLGELVCLSDVCVDPNGETEGTTSVGPVTVTASVTATVTATNPGTTEGDASTTSPVDGSTGPTTEPTTAETSATQSTSDATESTSDTMGTTTGGPDECVPPPHVPCDAMANNLFTALGLDCPGEPAVTITTTGSVAAMATRTGFGGTAEWDPQEGSAFAVLGSGFTVDLNQATPPMDPDLDPTHCNDDLGAAYDLAAPPAPIDATPVAGDCVLDPMLIGTGDCSGSLDSLGGAVIADYTELRISAEVPATVTSLSYDFAFFSTEYPYYLGSQFNDIHIAWLESERWTGNIAYDAMGNPISVNSVLLDFQDDSGTTLELAGTCMRQHGGTSWTQTTAPVAAGETITLVLAISDVGDSILDSYVFLDDFAWGCSALDEPMTIPAP